MSGDASSSAKVNTYRKMLTEIVQENPFAAQDYFHPLFPPQVVIETTCACNQRCTYCGRRYIERSKGNMTRATFGKIVQEIAMESPCTDILPAFMGEALLGGDELFARLAMARRLGCRKIVLNTNGLLVEKYIPRILEGNIDRLCISCDAHDPETHRKLRPGKDADGLEAVRRGVHALTAAMKERGLGRPFVEVGCTVYDENQHEVDAFIAYWQEHGVIAKSHPKGFHAGVVPGGAFRVSTGPDRIPCGWGRDTAVILWNGNVVLCPCDADAKYVAGSIETQSLREIWNGPLKWIRELHHRRRFTDLPEICRKCPDWQTRTSNTFFPDEERKKEYVAFVQMGKPFVHQSAAAAPPPVID
jgi:radical SAM protein with 4Fe4S-binding SPASM domain